ncbi:recombinase family protein, partial [Klebsiella pneumoniae]|uniref:recombinase family protein n=1 Tax=Klebsiella pneumoniae TaxID=573 RepID=UPI002A4E2A53
MLIGYMRVSKADGSQSTNLQRDALIAAGVSLAHLYEDLASGRRDDRPGLAACLKALREGDTLIVWKRHCCKVSDEAAFCLIQRPYISKTLLT